MQHCNLYTGYNRIGRKIKKEDNSTIITSLNNINFTAHNSHSQTLSLSIAKELTTGGNMLLLKVDYSSDNDRTEF